MKAFIKTLRELTQDNNHGDAMLLVATHYGFRNEQQIFTAINSICNAEGCLPEKINEYRYKVMSRMLNHIKVIHPKEYAAVYDSL